MLDDDTKYVIVQTGYENNILSNMPSFYKDFNLKHYCEIKLFVSENKVYKPNYKTNTWDKNTHDQNEYNLIINIINLKVDSFILFEILESGTHNYDTILKLLSDVQDLDICAVFGIEKFDFKSLCGTVIVSFDAEAG
jgi:hypothetical protein